MSLLVECEVAGKHLLPALQAEGDLFVWIWIRRVRNSELSKAPSTRSVLPAATELCLISAGSRAASHSCKRER